MKRGLWFAIAIVMLARLPFLHISFFSVDEAVSAVAATEILEGGLPYRDAIDHRGPLTYYFYALVFSFSGKGNMWAIHFFYLVIHAGICFLVFLLGKRWLQNKIQASWATLVYALYSSCNYFTEGLAAHTEWLLSLSVVTAWLICFNGKKGSRFVLAGFFAGLAITSKQVALLDAFALALAIWIGKGSIREKFINSLAFTFGVFIAPLLFGLIFYQANALDDLIFYAFTYNTQFYLPELSLPSRIEASFKLLASFSLQNWIVFPVSILSVKWILSRWEGRQVSSQELSLLCWLGLSLAAALAGGRAFGHYLIPSFVPLALWSGKVLGEYVDLEKWINKKRILAIGVVVIFILGPLGWLFDRHKHMLKGDPSISEYKELSTYLKTHVPEDKKIFVWGFAPEIYVLSERRPASRFTFCNPLSGHLPAANETMADTRYAIVPGSWDSLAADFAKSPPGYIVDTQPAGFKSYQKYPIAQYPFLTTYLQNYGRDSLYIITNPGDSINIFKLLSN